MIGGGGTIYLVNMIITTDSLKSAIRRRKTWLAYDHDIMIAKMSKETFMRELISAYDKCISVSSYRDYTSNDRYSYYDRIADQRIYRPIDPRDIHVDYPNLRSDIGTYYGWGF